MNPTYRGVILATLLGMAAGLIPPPLGAFTVYCANCGTEWTQLMNKLQLIRQLEVAMQQLHIQIEQYQNLLQNTRHLPRRIWGEAMREISAVQQLLEQSQALAYSALNLEQQFAKRYGDYDTYLKRRMGESDWEAKYHQWSQETRDNALYTLRAAGLQALQMEQEDRLVRALQAMAESAQGRMQAIEIGNQLAAQSVRQVQKLRQLMMLELQMQADYLATQADKEAAQRAAMRKFTAPVTVPVNDGERF